MTQCSSGLTILEVRMSLREILACPGGVVARAERLAQLLELHAHIVHVGVDGDQIDVLGGLLVGRLDDVAAALATEAAAGRSGGVPLEEDVRGKERKLQRKSANNDL